MRRLVLVLFLILAGCNLFSDNPLSSQNQDPIDGSIIGTWSWNEENDRGFVHIGTGPDGKALLLTMVEFKKDGRMETTEFKGHSTTLASHRYLNLRRTKPEEMDKGYFFVAYKVTGDILECSILDADAFGKAIKDGSLKGEVLDPDGLLPTVLIHADQNALRQFVIHNAESLIRDTSKLKKVELSGGAERLLPDARPATLTEG